MFLFLFAVFVCLKEGWGQKVRNLQVSCIEMNTELNSNFEFAKVIVYYTVMCTSVSLLRLFDWCDSIGCSHANIDGIQFSYTCISVNFECCVFPIDGAS